MHPLYYFRKYLYNFWLIYPKNKMCKGCNRTADRHFFGNALQAEVDRSRSTRSGLKRLQNGGIGIPAGF